MGVIVTRSVGTAQTPQPGGTGDGRSGSYNIPISASDFIVTFSPSLSGAYQVVGNIINTVDASASSFTHTTTTKSVSAFKVELSGQTDTSNYQFDWIITVDGLSPSASGVYTLAEKKAIEMEMEFIASKANYYQEFTYTGSKLTNTGTWLTSAKTTKLFNKDLTYTGNKLTKTVLTRVSDGSTLTKDLTYSGNKLTSTTVTVA